MKTATASVLMVLSVCLAVSCAPREGRGTASATESRGASGGPGTGTIVVSHAVLGALVEELVGDGAKVRVLVPNGLDVHEWEPSARDIEATMAAGLVVVNGLGLEGGFQKTLDGARTAGRPFFVATDHVEVRIVGEGEGPAGKDADRMAGAKDPHIWTDPLAMKAVVLALAPVVKESLGLDVGPKATAIAASLDSLDAEIAAEVAGLPEGRRVLVTGHESLGYFARRYGFTIAGALVPGLSPEAETSASWLVDLKALIKRYRVPVIFTEVGTPPQVASAMSAETGARAIPLATHLVPDKGSLPDGKGSYADFERNLARTIVEGLK